MWSLVAAAVAAIAGGLTAYFSNRKATGRDRDLMDFNASEASINREFQSAEAQKAREFQEDIYTRYQSPQAQVRQYQEAGLNPALMYARGVTPVSLSSASLGPSGSSASASPSAISGVDGLMSMLGNLAKLPSEVELMSAQSEDLRASAVGKRIHNSFSPQLLEQELQQGELNILNTQAAITTAQFQWSLMSSQEQLNLVKAKLTEAEIKDVLASADLKEKQAATEALKQANLEVTNELLAAQIATEKMKPAMIAAQTVLTRNQGHSISLDNYQKEVTNSITELTGVSVPKTYPELVFKVAGAFTEKIDSGLSKAKNWLTRTGKRLLKF